MTSLRWPIYTAYHAEDLKVLHSAIVRFAPDHYTCSTLETMAWNTAIVMANHLCYAWPIYWTVISMAVWELPSTYIYSHYSTTWTVLFSIFCRLSFCVVLLPLWIFSFVFLSSRTPLVIPSTSHDFDLILVVRRLHRLSFWHANPSALHIDIRVTLRLYKRHIAY